MPPRSRPRASPARVRPALCALDSLRGLRRRRSYPIGRPRPLILAIAMLNAVAAPGKFVANSASRARPQSSPPPSSRASPTRRSSCRPARRPSPLPTSSSACRPHHLGFARSAARADTGTSNVGSSTRVVIAVAVSISSVAINIIVASTSVLGPAGSAHLAPLPSLRSRSAHDPPRSAWPYSSCCFVVLRCVVQRSACSSLIGRPRILGMISG